jgi:2-amino-4-hydroxy-6-hydroxymethyldihydropteridine diphosphokinase
MNTYYLGLGSNLGDRMGYLASAVHHLRATPGFANVRGSTVYETAPVGVTEQPDFLNLVVALESDLSPPAVLDACLAIELALGRVRTQRWGPRTIDLDVVHADIPWADDRLEVPHPRVRERGFVLTPLAELAPDLLVNGRRVDALAAKLGPGGLKKFATWAELDTRSRG